MDINTKIMKSTAFIMAAAMLIICALPLAASATSVPAYDTMYVRDNCSYLQSDEAKILDARCNWLYGAGLSMEIIIEDGSSASADLTADEYSSELEGGNGVIFAVCKDSGDMAFKAYGEAALTFDEATCAQIVNIAREKSENFDIYKACQSVVMNTDNFYNYGQPLSDSDFFMPSVVDLADYLTDEEAAAVSEKLDALRDKYEFDVAVSIEKTLWSDTAQTSADDTFDYYFYGGGLSDDGILLYISEEPRNYHLSTHSYGMTVFNDDGIEYMQSLIVPYLQSDDYYEACMAYADGAAELLQMAADGNPYSANKNNLGKAVGIGVIAALIVSFIAAKASNKGKVNEMNTAREKVDAHSYMIPGSFNLTMAQDVFLYRRVDRQLIEKNDSSGSSHVSSSGRSHGGGGGSY